MLDIATDRAAKEKIYLMNLKGRIDSVTSSDFNVFSRDILRAGHRYFLFDASLLEFISSAGISSLVSFARKLESLRGVAVFIHLNKEIQLTFSFFGLQNLLPVFSSEAAARLFLNEKMEKYGNSSLEIESKEIQKEKPAESAEQNTGRKPLVRDLGQPAPVAKEKPIEQPSVELAEKEDFLAEPEMVELPEAFELEIESDETLLEEEEIHAPSHPPEPKRETIPEPALHLPDAPDFFSEERNLPRKNHSRGVVEEQQKSPTTERGAVTYPEPAVREPHDPIRQQPLHEEEEVRPIEGWYLVHCDQCGVHMRVYQTGRHMCPECGIEFTVKADGSASFFEKLK